MIGKRLLLDTHVLLWALLDPDRLSAVCRDTLRDRRNIVLVSSVCAWEIATKHRIGKLPEAAAVIMDYAQHLKTFLAEELPITSRHALMAGSFPQAHRDPFDRILAAQSSLEGIPLVTSDPCFRDFPVTVVW